MSLPYLARLAFLCLACFFLVHAALGLVVSAAAPVAVRMAERVRPALAARLLLGLRLLPPAIALFVTVGLCVPSYLWLEPENSGESVGGVGLSAAVMGLTVLTVSLARAARSWVRSFRYSRDCRRLGQEARFEGEPCPVWLIAGKDPLFALAGILRPRLLASQGAIEALTGEQLSAALRHERAHWTSRDNLKRLLILLAPGILPGLGFSRLERGWMRFTEWAADDRAVSGDSSRSLSLAGALVSVARLGAAPPGHLVTSILGNSQDLAERVERLLDAPAVPSENRVSATMVTAALVAAAMLAALMLRPGMLYFVHRMAERLMH